MSALGLTELYQALPHDYDEEQAEAWRTVPGIRDYYEFGGHRLQLHADRDGILTSVILTE